MVLERELAALRRAGRAVVVAQEVGLVAERDEGAGVVVRHREDRQAELLVVLHHGALAVPVARPVGRVVISRAEGLLVIARCEPLRRVRIGRRELVVVLEHPVHVPVAAPPGRVERVRRLAGLARVDALRGRDAADVVVDAPGGVEVSARRVVLRGLRPAPLGGERRRQREPRDQGREGEPARRAVVRGTKRAWGGHYHGAPIRPVAAGTRASPMNESTKGRG